ncbi:MAG: glycosyltransferase family 9 protein [Mucilaginibacter sp.]
MMNTWQKCKRILCIRPDNMGDLVMTGPALRALKETFNCKITVLTSSMAAGIAGLMPEIDDIMIFDVPWVKNNSEPEARAFQQMVDEISGRQFDAAVVFNVYSQNPLPTVMLAYLAGIPLRLSYCRENPYRLLTDWIPDKEPYTYIRHQVRRDLELVAAIGANTKDNRLRLSIDDTIINEAKSKLIQYDIDINKPWLIFHPGVSERKREYPKENWAKAACVLSENHQILFTGVSSEKQLCRDIIEMSGTNCHNLAGVFSLKEFTALIKIVPLVVSVNTGTIHIAAAVGTPAVVLYALTNPQHTPWQIPCRVLPYQVPANLHSRNEVIRHANQFLYQEQVLTPNADDIIRAVDELLNVGNVSFANEAILQPFQTPLENQAG